MRPRLYNGFNMLHIYEHVCMVFLFIIMFCIAIPADVRACDVTDIDVWVGIDEDEAEDADTTDIEVFAKTSFGVFVEWNAYGGLNDGNFYIQVRNRPTALLDSTVHADDQWPWEETFDIDPSPGWEDGDSEDVYAKVKRVDFSYHDSYDLKMGFDCTVDVGGIYQGGDLWWFNGENPDNYAIQVTLLAPELSTGTFEWSITAGSGKITFNNGGADSDTITATDDNTVIMKSTAKSGSTPGDVTVQLEHDGTVKDTIDTEVYAPNSLVHSSDTHSPFYNGYASLIAYTLKDQFGDVMPYSIESNEDFTTSDDTDYPGGDNWGMPSEASFSPLPSAWGDLIRMSGTPRTPELQNPCSGSTKVDHYEGDFYIGSLTTGNGVNVKSLKWQRYRDHGEHE